MDCCNQKNKQEAGQKKNGFWKGLVYGLIPHIGCIAFIVFSILGTTTAAALFKPLLLNPYFFHILAALSFVFATISAFFYFKKQGFIALKKAEREPGVNYFKTGLKRKWKYLALLYGATIGINLLLFMIIFPIAANVSAGAPLTAAISSFFGANQESLLFDSESLISLQVDIPCPGHAPLIINELKQINGVENVNFKFPNLFDVGYDSEKTSTEQILSLKVFETYQPSIKTAKQGEKAEANEPDRSSQVLSSADACCGNNGGCGCGCGN